MDLNNILNSIVNKEEGEAIKISYYIIKYCNDKKIEITNLKLIKLLYFINIEYMLKNDGKAIFNEEFLAWRHGPVLESVYERFCYGIILPENEKMEEIFKILETNKKDVINNVLKKLANLSAWELVDKTHIFNGPWYNTYNKYKDKDGICKAKISNEDIYKFYKENYGQI